MRTAARKDDNHNEIKDCFSSLGWSVLDVAQLKKCCDLFVSKKGETVAVEIKDGNKPPSQRKLTSGEQTFKDTWNGNWRLVESIDDVLQINREQREKNRRR